jgi:hypothetical protein
MTTVTRLNSLTSQQPLNAVQNPAVTDRAPFPVVNIAAMTPSKREGNGGLTAFTFLVTRTAIPMAGSVNWSVIHGSTNAADFSGLTSGILEFASDETRKTITVWVQGDFLAEADEMFAVQLSSPMNVGLGTTSAASATLVNDDLPRLSIAANPTVQEGTGLSGATTLHDFTVTRDLGIGASTVKWAVMHRGTNAQDFSGATSGVLNFAMGEISKRITVRVVADALIEDDEDFAVQLSDPTNAVLATTSASTSATATAMILNDDVHALRITATTPSKNEGNAGLTPFLFTVTRSAGVGTSEVTWNVVHGTTSYTDFSGDINGVLYFNSGETSKTITVKVIGDTVPEATETFDVKLYNAYDATVVTDTARATIVNDDLSSLTLTAAATSRPEGSTIDGSTTPFTFTVTRNSDIGTSSANWTLAHGTTNASDFSGSTRGTVSFANAETMKTITVNVVGDTVPEKDETFSVVLSQPVGARLPNTTVPMTILNDDLAASPAAFLTLSLRPTEVGLVAMPR